MTDPTNVFAMDDIKFMTGYNVEPVVASETAVIEAITRYYPSGAGRQGGEEGRAAPAAPGATCTAPRRSRWSPRPSRRRRAADDDVEVLEELEQIDVASLEKQGGEAPVIRLVNLMLMSAIQKGASDIHIEPYEKEFRVRFRIDGILYNVMAPPMKFRDAITSRIKIMAKLDIAEKRLPQDGRIKIRFAADGATKEIDFRVSCLPTLFGEKIVLRLLDKDKLMLDMTKLGFEPESLAKLEAAIAKPWGMVLVTGPTGSGKTNTLYSSIAQDQHARNQHHDRGGPGRVQPRRRQPGPGPREHRPELRRGAALVPAPGPEHHPGRRNPRLRDRGNRGQGRAHRPPGAVDAAHQRRAEHDQPPDEHGHRAVPGRELGQPDLRPAPGAAGLRQLQGADHPHAPQALIEAGFTPEEAQRGRAEAGNGCEKCNSTGYKGRVGLYEVMEITDELRELILVGASALELQRKAIEEGMITLRASGLRKVKDGVTTIEEVVRETVK